MNHFSEYTSEVKLRQLCATKENLTSFNMVCDRHTGLRKGHAFTENSHSNEAVHAANKLNGVQIGPNVIKACLSRPQDLSTTNANLHMTEIPKNLVDS